MQLTLFAIEKKINIKKNIIPSYKKCNKIKDNLKEWNTVQHIYRYQTFYKICERLFILTYDHQLACLDYYIDEEKDEKKHYTVMYACIEDTANLPIGERVKKHLDLLRKVINQDEGLEYDEKKIDSEIMTLFS